MATLTISVDHKVLNRYTLDPDKEIHIGRSAENDIVVNDKAISTRHASITFDHSHFTITDMGSRNGIYFGGKAVKKHRLRHGDVVSICKYQLVFDDQKSGEMKESIPGPVTMILDELDQLALASKAEIDKKEESVPNTTDNQQPLLIVKFKDKVLYKYPLADEKTTVGRGAKNQIVLDNPAVSTSHAMVVKKKDGFELSDMKSKNGTFVNDKKISSHSLQKGDIIAIGRHELVFEIDTAADYTSTQQHPSAANPILTPEPTTVLDTRKYKDMLHRSKGDMATGKAELAYLSGGSGKVPIKKNILSIGSAVECDIVAKGLLVGENAAFVMIKSDGYYLTYNRGFAKPTVNGEKVDGSRKLYDGDVIKIGSVTMQFGL